MPSICVSSVSICGSNPVQIALQQNRRRHFIHFLFAFVAADAALDQNFVRLRTRQPLVPHFYRDGDGGFQNADERLHFLRRRTVTAVHVARQADEDEVNLLLAEDFFQAREKIYERLGEDIFQGLRDGFGFVAHGDADALAAVIEGEDSHCAHSLPQTQENSMTRMAKYF
jgi:hypothetical protein